MKEIEKILNQVEDCIKNQYYKPVETEKVELKTTPPNLKSASSLLQSVCAFLNTSGGIILLGIKDNNNVQPKNYELKGFNYDFEDNIGKLGLQFTDKNFKPIDVSECIVNHEIIDFLDKKVCAIYVDKLADDKKFAFYEKTAYRRVMTGDTKISPDDIDKYEEFKEEIKNARELEAVPNASISDLSVHKLNDYIQRLNTETRTETVKPTIEDALPFLTRKKFIIGQNVTTLGILVCGEHVKDFLGWRAQVDGFVDTPFEIAQDKKSFADNIIPLMEKSYGYILKNIQVGVTVEKGGTGKPEYPADLLRETINNALAHRDYSVDKYVNINIKPNAHIEIRNPGNFQKQLLIEEPDHEIPVRRIIPDSKPRNPKLADVLSVFKKREGKSIGMSSLVNEALENKIDLPYYRFYSNEDLGLFIQKGKLADESFLAFINSFDLFIERLLNGANLTDEDIAVMAYFYKSEKANELYRHTILLTPDNNHFNSIARLEKSGLIFKHPKSPKLYPVYLLHRDLMRENFNTELRDIYGGAFDDLSDIYKQTLSLIYQVNTYSKNNSVSATQAGRFLYYKNNLPLSDIKAFDNFKRKIYGVFKKLVNGRFILEENKEYFINKKFERKSSLFDTK